MNELEYVTLSSSEGFGDLGTFGIRIQIAGTMLPKNIKTDAILNLGYDMVEKLRDEIIAENLAQDPKEQNHREGQRAQILHMFPSSIFVEEVPNGYSNSGFYRNKPWFIVTTRVGRIKIGWRKRVLVIDWSDSANRSYADDLFPYENVTKGDHMIHAWNYQDAKRYLDVLLA